MRVLMGLPDEAGCGHYRVRYPGLVAKADGCDVRFASEIRQQRAIGADGRDHVTDVPEVSSENTDVVVLQRPLSRSNVEMIPHFKRKGVAVVVDVDDDFDCVDPSHIGWRLYQGHLNPDSNRAWLRLAAKHADLVTVTTPALARRYGAHGRVRVLPNLVPEAMLHTAPADRPDGRTVGWGGFVGTHPHDLQVTHGGVSDVMRSADARFLNVGNGEGVQKALHLGDDQEFAITGPVAFKDYPSQIARFSVGIVPLADTRFNQAKSALKGLEYAAVGVPFVASPTDDYVRVVEQGLGVTAAPRARNWHRAIERLLRDPAEAREQGRSVVAEKFTYERQGWRWQEAWTDALINYQDAFGKALAS